MFRLTKNNDWKLETSLKFYIKFLKRLTALQVCVLSLRVPITGIHLQSSIEKSRARPSGRAKLMGCLGLKSRAASK